MALTKIGSIGINTGIAFAGVTTIATLNASDNVLSVGGTVNFVSDVSIGGTVSIAGTLTYEDVTNVDAVGLITARDGIKVGSGITLSVDGDIFATGVVTATTFSGAFTGDGSALTGIEAGITTEAASISGITTYLNLSKDDHELIVTGNNTISVIGGAQGTSHSLRIQNSGISTVTLDSTYFKFPSSAAPSLPTSDGAISMISFTVHKAGAVGVNTILLAGASVSFG